MNSEGCRGWAVGRCEVAVPISLVEVIVTQSDDRENVTS